MGHDGTLDEWSEDEESGCEDVVAFGIYIENADGDKAVAVVQSIAQVVDDGARIELLMCIRRAAWRKVWLDHEGNVLRSCSKAVPAIGHYSELYFILRPMNVNNPCMIRSV